MGAELKVGGELMHAETRTPDFSGWATKYGIKCSDGRTIQGGAFKHQDGQQVPLVYQHGHGELTNVLGHVILHDRGDEGTYCHGFFNNTENGKNAKLAVEHGDLKSLSIYANKLMEKSKQVMHGMIKEVSLVLSGANPGALIDNVQIAHGEGLLAELDDEAVIFMGEEQTEIEHVDADEDDRTLQDVYDSMTEEQKRVTTYLVGSAAKGDVAEHAEGDDAPTDDERTLQDVYDSMNDEQKKLVDYMVGAALDQDGTDAAPATTEDTPDTPDKATPAAAHTDTDTDKDVIHMTRNVFEQNHGANERKNVKDGGTALSHDDMKEILELGAKNKSLKHGLQEYALAHGIHNIEALFPEAKNFTQTPEWDSRRMEWVKGVLDKTRKIPFSRVKTMTADLTQDEARAKGYIKGTFKEQEWFDLTHRETGPTTVYKKQQLDRDDIVDITDFDVVVWMKGEMRLMLEEEIARAILIGDGRSSDAADKIRDPAGASSGNGIRSILHDNDLYAKTEYISVTDNGSEYGPEISDRILESMVWYKGTPGPTFYTTLPIITRIMLTRDGFGKRLWKNWDEFAQEIGCTSIVAVEVAETEPDLVGIIVNLADYILGNDKGGEINLFDDFDLDYNQFKYLIETRLSGALAKIRSAIIIRLAADGAILVVPVSPQFNQATGVLTPATTTGVEYRRADTNEVVDAPLTLDPGESVKVFAVAEDGHYFSNNQGDEWTFTRPAA